MRAPISATLVFGIEFRKRGLRLPIIAVAGMFITFARLLAVGAALAVVVAAVIGFPCFRIPIVGHCFALVTLALSEVVRLFIIATRDVTGGSLGMMPLRHLGGTSLYAQYHMYINPKTTSGVAISLRIVFAAIVGGMFVALGPTVGAIFTILLSESLRIVIGVEVVGLDTTLYGLLLVLFIIFMPKGILGAALDWYHGRAALARPELEVPGEEKGRTVA